MGLVGTGADGLRVYLTGAGVTGELQPCHALSLGAYRSAVQVGGATFERWNAIRGLAVHYVAGYNGVGIGTLTAKGEDSLAWTAPGGTEGAEVTVLEGETRVLTGLADPPGYGDSQYIVVERTSSDALAGVESVQCMATLNDVFGGTDFETGETNSRRLAVMVYSMLTTVQPTLNLLALTDSVTTVTSTLGASGAGTVVKTGAFAAWPSSGLVHAVNGGTSREVAYYASRTDDQLNVSAAGRAQLSTSASAWNTNDLLYAVPWARVAFQTPSSGALTDLRTAGEEGAVSGLTWKAAPLTALSANLAPGAQVGVWIERWRPAEVGIAFPVSLRVSWPGYVKEFHGLFRCGDTAVAQWEYFLGTDELPDLEGTPESVSGTLPFEGAALTPGHTYWRGVQYRNQWGLAGGVKALERIDVDDDGSALGPPPAGPDLVQVAPRPGGLVRVTAVYYPSREGTASEVALYRAETWLIYVGEDGEDPDPEGDTPVEVSMGRTSSSATPGQAAELLTWDTTTAVLEGTPVGVVVRTRREDAGGDRDSENETVVRCDALWYSAGAPVGMPSWGRLHGVHWDPGQRADTVYVDEGNNIRFEVKDGRTEFWADDVLVWCLWYGNEGVSDGLYTTFALVTDAVSGAAELEDEDDGSEGVEVAEWGAQKTLHVVVRGERRLEIDVTAETITVESVSSAGEVVETAAPYPVWRLWDGTAFQVWDASEVRYRTAASVSWEGELVLAAPWKSRETEAECLELS